MACIFKKIKIKIIQYSGGYREESKKEYFCLDNSEGEEGPAYLTTVNENA